MESILNGSPLTGLNILNCANEGVGVVESKFMTEDIMAAVNKAAAGIADGTVTVTNVMDN